jgi:hypothetical protein
MEKTEKLTFREWFENVWYHYKWLIIFGAMLLTLIVISAVQMLSNDDPDVNILHVGPMTINPVVGEQIESTVGGLAGDYNEDGDVKVNILDITVNKFGTAEENAVNYDHNNNAMKRFQTEIRAGDAVIYLLDEEYFNICLGEGLLTPFEEVVDDAYMPENVIEGCGVKLSELDAYSLDGLKDIPEGAILCLRRSPDKDEIAYGRTMETWNGNRKTFLNILKYKKN